VTKLEAPVLKAGGGEPLSYLLFNLGNRPCVDQYSANNIDSWGLRFEDSIQATSIFL